MADEAEPYQSLYRRFRPQRFADVRGQDHVTLALTNMVRDSRVAQAFLFSGPRGTGKTSTARILAMALNCLDPQDGEPDGRCESCLRVRAGSSLDVHELDAASNNGVDAMRDLVARSALGTPGRWKVYIIDEVHMLSAAASNALLKTLEEPPAHVVFVLATTDPQKVLETIRSRTQHYEFHLLPPALLTSLLTDISQEAGITVEAHDLEQVVKRGKGSARDALSVLDQLAASGTVDDDSAVVEELTEGLCEKDAARALVAIDAGVAAGRDPRQLAVDLLEYLRSGFLATVAPAVGGEAADRAAEQARRMGLPGLVRTMEVVGEALAEMRDSLDTRITLEVAVVRVARPEADHSPAALLERIDRLERTLAGHGPAAAPTAPTGPATAAPATGVAAPQSPRAPATAPPATGVPADAAPSTTAQAPPSPAAPPATGVPADAAPSTTAQAPPSPAAPPTPAAGGPRATLGAFRQRPAATDAPPAPAPAPSPPAVPPSASSPSGPITLPTRDALTQAWGDVVLARLSPKTKSRFSAGRFVSVDGGVAVFGLPNPMHRDRAEEVRAEVEAALAAHFGNPFPIRLIVDDGRPPPEVIIVVDEDHDDPRELDDAPAAVTSPEERLKVAFPGAEEVPS